MALALAPLAAPRGGRAAPADVLEPGGEALVPPPPPSPLPLY